MKRSGVLKCLVILSNLLIASPIVTAKSVGVTLNPTGLSINVVCPGTQGGTYNLSNFGEYIGGYGYENLLSQTNDIYFQSSCLPSDIPGQLDNYANASIKYDSTSGRITCTYTSSEPSNANFSVGYKLTNGHGGVVVSQSNNEVNLFFPIGVRTL